MARRAKVGFDCYVSNRRIAFRCSARNTDIEEPLFQRVVKSICENYTDEMGGAVVIIENRFYQSVGEFVGWLGRKVRKLVHAHD